MSDIEKEIQHDGDIKQEDEELFSTHLMKETKKSAKPWYAIF